MDGPAPTPNPPSGTHTPLVVNTGIAGAVDAGSNLISRLGGFSPQQAQTAAVMVLILFVCGILGYQMWMGQRQQADTLAMVIRSMESESEKNRAAIALEFERNRTVFAETTRQSVASSTKLSIELNRLEQVVTVLSSSLSEIKKKP